MPENRHAKFKKYWESLGKPPLEFSFGQGWLAVTSGPAFYEVQDFRLAGDRHWELRREWIDSDFTLPIECKRPNTTIWRTVSLPKWDADMDYREAEPSTTKVHLSGTVWNLDKLSQETPKAPTDTGAHYRHYYRIKLTEEVKNSDYFVIQLDPARIADIYGIANMVQQSVLKKCLKAGNRGHKDIYRDIADMRTALDRWEQMLREDEQNAD